MITKRIISSLFIVAILLLAFAGCGSSALQLGIASATKEQFMAETQAPVTVTATLATTVETTAEIGETSAAIAETSAATTQAPTTITTTTQKPTTIAPTPKPTTIAVINNNDSSSKYVLNTNTMKFHEPSCGSAAKIHPENREDVTDSRENIIAKGFSPCGNCDP